jgi:predicted cupin superfamily sugar epimerase
MSPEVQDLILRFGLKEHPEGGFYRETYRAAGTIPAQALPPEFGGGRSYATAIHFLLPEGRISRFHRLKSDELWHFYLGGPLEICRISPAGQAVLLTLGSNPVAGNVLQCAIPAGDWFAAKPCPGSRYALAGCTVSPGFDFSDLIMAKPGELLALFPEHAALIGRFSA